MITSRDHAQKSHKSQREISGQEEGKSERKRASREGNEGEFDQNTLSTLGNCLTEPIIIYNVYVIIESLRKCI